MPQELMQYRYKRICLLAALLWMAVIFSFSARPADESARMSHSVGDWVGRVFVPGYEEWDEASRQEFAENIDYPVRKCAHAGEYAVLGVLLTMALTDRRRVMPAAAIGILYAASDEIHQLFVPGRSGQLRDVLLDSAGVAAGILLAWAVGLLYQKAAAYAAARRDVKRRGQL